MAKTRILKINRITRCRRITAAAVGGAASGIFRALVTWLLDQLQ